MRVNATVMSVCLLLTPMVLAADQETQTTAETSKSLAYATDKETNGRVEVVERRQHQCLHRIHRART